MPTTKASQDKVDSTLTSLLNTPMSLYTATKLWNVIAETTDIDTCLEMQMKDGIIYRLVDAQPIPSSHVFWRVTLEPRIEQAPPYRRLTHEGTPLDQIPWDPNSPVQRDWVETMQVNSRDIDHVLIRGY